MKRKLKKEKYSMDVVDILNVIMQHGINQLEMYVQNVKKKENFLIEKKKYLRKLEKNIILNLITKM